MPDTLTRPVTLHRRTTGPLAVLLAIVLAGTTAPLLSILDDGRRENLTVANESDWIIGVELVSDSGSRMPLATIDPRTTASIDDVLSPGRTWRVRWTFEGREQAVTTVTDRALGDRRFTLAVPPEVAARLEAADVPPSP
jgi:hypothetical protein